MAPLVQKMQIFDKDFKELFQNSALSNQLLYYSRDPNKHTRTLINSSIYFLPVLSYCDPYVY